MDLGGRGPHGWSRLVGRDDEIEGVAAAVTKARLVSLVGAGGVGKTRLASAAVSRVADGFAEGARTVWLASLRDQSLVWDEIGAAVGLPRTGGVNRTRSLIDWLNGRELLLVLDNCEHVLDTVAEIVELLLSHVDELRVLVTSREPLLIPGETVYAVAPLATPPADAPAEAIASSASVRLFLERAGARDRRLVPAPEDYPLVAAVCRRLDGLPLALELAAARAGAVGMPRLAQRLLATDSLAWEAVSARGLPARHASLRAVFEWSEALLDAYESALLRRLSVFAGGFELTALDGVLSGLAGTDADVDAMLTRLIDKSLVMRDHAVDRFSLMETVREFAARRLADSGEHAEISEAHARWFLGVAEQVGAGVSSGPERAWLERLAADEDNLRVTLRWAIEHDEAAALATAAGLPVFWWSLAQHREGFEWLRQAYVAAADVAPPQLRAAALFGMAFLWAHDSDDWETAAGYLDEGIALVADSDPAPAILGYLLCLRGECHAFRGEHATAIELTENGEQILRRHPDPWGQAFAAWNVGFARQGAGDLTGARDCYQRMVQIQTEHGSRLELMIGYNSLAELAERDGDLGSARSLYEQALQMRRELGAVRLGYVHGSLPRSLLALARVCAAQGDTRAARTALDEAIPGAQQMRDEQTVQLCHELAAVLAGPVTATGVLVREGPGWRIEYADSSHHEHARLADAKGLRHLHELLAHPRRSIPALTLAGLADGRPHSDSDAGPMLDDQARAAYRARLAHLAEEADAADRAGDTSRSAAAAAERAALLAELARATGLGGRVRRAGSTRERARLNVTRTIRDAIAKIAEQCPALAAQLSAGIRTGTHCSYEPDPPVSWRL